MASVFMLLDLEELHRKDIMESEQIGPIFFSENSYEKGTTKCEEKKLVTFEVKRKSILRLIERCNRLVGGVR
ncbi:hypothetical protein RJT34_14409 [Clitoria ternatea]|uniref:Uncharacterized protein n=1 Tax=Clitoria ternatea TaxID=43366 RepID=A0AAN9JT92_CLITE